MKRMMILLSKVLIILFVAILSVTFFPSRSSVGANTYTATGADNETEEVVKYLASERGISIEEARTHIEWQEKAGELGNKLEDILPKSDYGGIWINRSNDRITVGVAGDTNTQESSEQKILRELHAAELSDAADTVPVKYSYETLVQITEAIHKLHQELGVDKEWPIQVGPKIDQNKIQVDVPEERHLTSAHRKVLALIEEKYKHQVFLRTYNERPQLEAECNWWFCNSPLRGGVGIKGSASGGNIYCTAGPIVQGNATGNLYVLTAGHCASGGNSWSSETYGYTNRHIGTITYSAYDEETPIDAMIINTVNTDFTSVMGKILKRSGSEWSSVSGYNDTPPSYNEEYNMATHSSNVVGERICISPAVTGGWPTEPNGGSCGEVEQVNVYFTAGGITTRTHRAGYCSRNGDSGSPVFAGSNKVKGIHRGAGSSSSSVCSHYKYYTPISTILNGFESSGHAISIY